jgi:hypothetical protein
MDEGTFNKSFAECWVCGKERGGADGPQHCGWCLQWHCPDCPCPGLVAWEDRHFKGVEGGEEPDCCGAYMSLDDIPCFTCRRAPKDGVEFVMCDRCAYWHCCECGCPSPEPSENEEK